jgi:hypothetical protein
LEFEALQLNYVCWGKDMDVELGNLSFKYCFVISQVAWIKYLTLLNLNLTFLK